MAMSQIIQSLGVDNYSRIVILTGAGISVASGLPTFRGEGGIYTEDVEWISDSNNLPGSLPDVWRFYGGRRAQFSEAKPNAGHFAIAELQRRRGPEAVTVITQNVDGLHQRAGCIDVIELHGSLSKTRCTSVDCTSDPFDDWSVYDAPPPCPVCTSPLRPAITLFNEMLSAEADWKSKRALRDVDVFIAVGTSGMVWPAANFVRSAEYVGARTVYVSKDPMTPPNRSFQRSYIGLAEELLSLLLG